MNRDLDTSTPDLPQNPTMVDFNNHSLLLKEQLQAGVMLNHIEQIEKL